jgi:hypothetical protein
MVTLSVELTDLEYAALAHIAIDPQDWFQDMVKLRCKNTIHEIANNKIKEMIADPSVKSIPADKEEIFESLVSEGCIKCAAEMLEEENERTKTMVSTANDLIPETPALDDSRKISF